MVEDLSADPEYKHKRILETHVTIDKKLQALGKNEDVTS